HLFADGAVLRVVSALGTRVARRRAFLFLLHLAFRAALLDGPRRPVEGPRTSAAEAPTRNDSAASRVFPRCTGKHLATLSGIVEISLRPHPTQPRETHTHNKKHPRQSVLPACIYLCSSPCRPD